jgi:hypothetical protein
MIKLYELFSFVRLFRKQSPSVLEDYTQLIVKLSVFFPQGTSPFANVHFVNDIQTAISLAYLRAKRNLVEKDLYSFQTEAYKVNSKLWGFVKDKIKEAGADQATASFLRETLSVTLNWNNPVVHVLNRQIDASTDFLMKYWDPDISDSFLFETGLSKYNLTKGTLSMRSQVSIILAESAILKEYLKVCLNLMNEDSEDFKAVLSRFQELHSI